MARDGEILNKGILQRMADYFNLGGVKRSPGFLNMDDVKAVYVLGQEDLPVFSLGKSFPTALDIGGASTYSLDITGAVSKGILGALYVNDGYALDLVSLDVNLAYSEAGATSDNATVLDLMLVRFENYGSGNQNIYFWFPRWQTVQMGRLNYRFGLSGFLRGNDLQLTSFTSLHIPAADRFALVIGRPDGGVFPADTSMMIQAHAFTRPLQLQEPYVPPS